MENNRRELYLGDGIYAKFDGEYIWLEMDTVDSKGNIRTKRIPLEKDVWISLVAFADIVWGVLRP